MRQLVQSLLDACQRDAERLRFADESDLPQTVAPTRWVDLSPSRHAAIIEMLAGTGQLRSLETVTDRLGRECLALGLTSPQRPEFEVRIVLNAGD